LAGVPVQACQLIPGEHAERQVPGEQPSGALEVRPEADRALDPAGHHQRGQHRQGKVRGLN